MSEPLVTYPAGSTSESSQVLAVTQLDGRVLFAVERTPCHPESPRWPDQPADRATVAINGTRAPVQLAEGHLLDGRLALGAQDDGRLALGAQDDGRLALGAQDDGRLALGAQDDGSDADARGVPCVVHSLPAALAPTVGEQVTLSVDEGYRRALSRSHSRCHLVSLALNAALAQEWRKEPPARDSLGNPDFDKLAIATSEIDEHGSLDCYRVGKHLRKAGFSVQALDDPDALAQRVQEIARAWLLSSPEIHVTPGECPLAERRTWSCELPEGTASFPCGGTHPSQMEPDEGLEVTLAWEPEERRLKMRAQSRTFHL